MGDEVGIDEDTVRRAEGSVGSEEHVRRGSLDMVGDFITGLLLLWLFGRWLESFVAGFDRALHLRGLVVVNLKMKSRWLLTCANFLVFFATPILNG